MTTEAFIGLGTIFGRSTSQSGTFTPLAQINSIGGPNKSRATEEVTTLDSEGGYEEFITGLRNSGEISLTMNFTRASYEVLNDDFEDDTAYWYQIALPDADQTKLTFLGLVINLSMAVPLPNKVTATATIKISGKPFLTYVGGGGTTFLS